MNPRPSSQEVVETALATARPAGRVVLVEESSTINVRWARSTLTTDGDTSTRSVTVVDFAAVTGGVSVGVASGPVHTPDDIDRLVQAAAASAAEGSPAEDASDLIVGAEVSPDWTHAAGRTDGDALAVLTPALGEVLREGRLTEVEYFGYAEYNVSTTYLGTSTGLRLRHEQPATRFELCGKSHGRSRSAWAGRSARRPDQIDVASCAAEIRRGLAWQATVVQVAPGRHRAILSPSATADLVVYALWSSALRDAAEGRSVYSGGGPSGTRLGERLTPAGLTVAGDPYAAGLESVPFVTATGSSAVSSAFDNGARIGPTTWIDRGVLSSLITTRASARTYSMADTPGVDNLLVDLDTGTGELDDLVHRTGDGLLLTCLWYIRTVDPQSLLVTGLTRDGVYVVRDGEVVGAAGNFRFNESPVGMLARITDGTSSIAALPREWGDWFTRAKTPALSVADFNFSTASDAL